MQFDLACTPPSVANRESTGRTSTLVRIATMASLATDLQIDQASEAVPHPYFRPAIPLQTIRTRHGTMHHGFDEENKGVARFVFRICPFAFCLSSSLEQDAFCRTPARQLDAKQCRSLSIFAAS